MREILPIERNMKKRIIAIITISIVLAGCASTRDPSLAPGVYREGGGVYSSSAMGFNNPTRSAVRQCQMDGNKRLSILTSTTERGISGTNYAKLIFRCE